MTTIELHELKGFSEKDQAKFIESVSKLQEVINSMEFMQRVLDFKFIDKGGLTNSQILDLLLSGADKFGAADGDIDLYVELYNKWYSSAIGYSLPSKCWHWINQKFFKTMTVAEIAANIIHEYAHKLDFHHSFKRTPTRKYSVPYGLGSIVEQIINEGL